MSKRSSVYACARTLVLALLAGLPAAAHAAIIHVPAGGDLQAAIDAAQPGDTLTLEAGATYVGNFKLPIHGGTSYITIRSAAPDRLLPRGGVRISPAYAAYLPKLKSPNSMPALRTLPAAGYWRLMFVELQANEKGQGDILALGNGGSAQDTLEEVPHHLIVDRVYIHGDPVDGQKRGIGLNSAATTIINSHIADIKAIGQDTQAIGGWNGPGPYRIENNFLEASTEVFLLGGDDPKIPGLIPSDVLFRGNTLTRPVRWRDPIVPTPAGVRATVTQDGSLAAGTYGYRVVARHPVSTTTARSNPSAEFTVTVGAGGRIRLQWTPVPGATEYLVYGRTPGAPNAYWKVTAPEFTDSGAVAGTAGTPSSKGTVWQVKNLFELKNAQRVQVDHNLMENNWSAAQNGYAILLTPRNQYGDCTWCVVRDVTFEYNVVRHIAGGVNLLGRDYINPSEQTTNIVIRHNEFSGLGRDWGGSGYFMTISDQPGRTIVDHNTIISPRGSGVITVAGDPISGFEFTNNVMRHHTYGIFGAGVGTGNSTINTYFPGAIVTRNVFAGGCASRYPSGNEFPTVAEFEARFVDYAASNFALKSGTSWIASGTDGRDLGADMTELAATVTVTPADPPSILTTSLPATTEGDMYSATLQAHGGVQPYHWSIVDGALPGGLTLDGASGAIAGVAAAFGEFTLMLRVEDGAGATASQPLVLQVARFIPPVSLLTSELTGGIVGTPYAAALEASGGEGSFTWAVTSGALPQGLALSAAGQLSGEPAQAGTATVQISVFDAADASRMASRVYSVAIAPAPNRAPSVTITAPTTGASVTLGSALTLAATARDEDGSVVEVEFQVNDVAVGVSRAYPHTMTWPVNSGGTFTITAVARDDDGARTVSTPVTVTASAPREVVLYAGDVRRVQGDFQLVGDATAAGGIRLWNPNRAVARVGISATPTSFAEYTFYAEAGRSYHLWLRASAEKNSYNNDSIWVQFSNVAGAAIGTTSAVSVILEDGASAGVSGWGWQDNGYGPGVVAAAIVFETTGLQTIRLQPREDGISIDQIVLSSERYLVASPGALKNDTTILAR